MLIIGCDYHPAFQQIAFVDTDTGELQERRLQHREEAEKFYRDLAAQEMKVRVGMEASGHARWFERLLGELQIELWIGDAAEIRTKRVRKQKTDRQDAQPTVAPTPDGAGAHADHEPAASRSAQRGPRLQEKVVAGSRTGTTGGIPVSPMGEPTPAGFAGVVGSPESNDRRPDPDD